MTQLFHPSINSFAKASIAGVVLGVGLMVCAATAVERSPFVTHLHEPITQPVAFSHQHHITDLGMDCRFCHTSVETSAFAGVPSLDTCMTCHSQIWRDSPMLAPVRESFASDRPIQWARVNNLPDYSYFQHDIHIHKGVGCETCHGRVDEMPLTWKAQTLHMEWCLECHRNPTPYLRPKEHVFDMGYQLSTQTAQLGVAQKSELGTQRITDCVSCHR